MDKKNEKLNVEVFDYSTIPKFMKDHGRFCLWKLVMKPGKTKPDKIPYQLNGKRADATNPQHYSSFEETVEAFAKGGYAGIGVGCFESLRLVDVEDCAVYGKLDTRGQDIVDTLDSYTELSPSGTGIHVFILADGFAYDSERYHINNRNTHVEVYAPDVTGKFLTLTGKAIHGTDGNERSKQLQGVLDKYMKRPDADAPAPVVDAPGSFLSDESVYTKDTSKKIRAVFKAKGEAGKPLCTNPPYGYVKDPEDKHHWIVEETSANVVRRIFNLCVDGYSPSQIASILEKDKVLVPSAYYKSIGIRYSANVPDNPYAWQSRTVADILAHPEYIGHTVNFKTYKKSYKSNKKLWNDSSKWQVFENTHEAIIDRKRHIVCTL